MNKNNESRQLLPIAPKITDCYEIKFGFENYEVLSLCEGASNDQFGYIEIVKKPCDENCTYEYKLLINEVEFNLYLDKEVYFFDLKTYLTDNIRYFHGGENINIKIEIIKNCHEIGGNGVGYLSVTEQVIQVAGFGDEYSVFEYVDDAYPPNYNPCEDSKTNGLKEAYNTCCDEGPRKIIMTSTHTLSYDSGHPGFTTFGVNLGFTSGIGITGGMSISQSYQFPYIDEVLSTSLSSSCPTVLNGSKEEGYCEYPAITTNYKHIIEYRYIDDCDLHTVDKQIGKPIHYFIPINHCFKQPPCKEFKICTPIEGDILIGNFNQVAFRDGCNRSLIMKVLNPEYVTTYTWILPDGTQYSESNEIVADQAGLYQCIVNDECCNEEIFEYYNCENLIYGEWSYDIGVYCSTLSCECEGLQKTYPICVTPHRYDEEWAFDEDRKKCTKNAYWTGQNGVEINLTNAVNEADIDAGDENVVKEPKVKTYYNEFGEECVKEYYCGENTDGDPQGSESEDPTFGDWGYDDWEENCYREVFCFGSDEPADDEDGWDVEDEGEAEIEWDFDQDDYECTGIVYCENEDNDMEETDIEVEEYPEAVWDWDDDENECFTKELYCDDAEQENITEEPSDIDDWEWDEDVEWGTVCFREVTCENANEEFTDFTDNVTWVYDESSNDECNDPEKPYYFKITCNGEDTEFYECLPDEPSMVLDPNYQFKDNIVLNTKKKEFLKGDKQYKYYRIFIYSIDGRSRKTQGIKRVSDVDKFISLFKTHNAQKNIMYIYTVYGENELLYSKKFFIAKK